MAASTEATLDPPAEDLEEGELPSSDEEEVEPSKGNESNINGPSVASDNDGTSNEENRKRPFESPERETTFKECSNESPKENRSKKLKTDDNVDEEAEEGEIFSDDEEAAYYPQLVKKRESKLQKRDDKSVSPSRSPFQHEEHQTEREEGERGGRMKPNHFQGGSPVRGPPPRWRDQENRRGKRGNKPSPGGSDLIGPPIRHDRLVGGDRKWDDPQRGNAPPSLTLEVIESRLSQCLALLPTPKINQCLSLDEMNYPAPPQWYLKSVAAYNKKHSRTNFQQQQQAELVDNKKLEAKENSMVAVGYNTTVNDISPVDASNFAKPSQQLPLVQQPPAASSIPPLFTPTDIPVTTGHSVPITVPLPSKDVSPLHGTTVTDHSLPVTPPTKSLKIVMPEDPAVALAEAPPTPESPPPRTTAKRARRRKATNVTRKKQLANLVAEKKLVSAKLIVSIDLSLVNLSSDLSYNSCNDDFSYDDYLDQLNNEEEEDDSAGEEKGYDFHMAAADFWIDTRPSSGGVDPLEEDFAFGGPAGKEKKKANVSLKSLVGQQVDDAIMLEEGKGWNKGKRKGLSGMKIPRKKDVVQNSKQPPVAVQEKEKREERNNFEQHQQEPEQQQSSKPCKYFLNGHCIHGDSCQYSHNVKREKKREMCKFYLQDACDKGDDCLYYHGSFPCKYFHTRHMCYHGDKCKFSHAPLNDETYDILMGVIDPSMRDFVKYPVPLSPETSTGILGPMPVPLPLAPPPSLPVQQAPPIQVLIPATSPPQPLLLQPVPYAPPTEGTWLPTETIGHAPHNPAAAINGPVNKKDEAPPIKANVPLSPNFDVTQLFPDPHPQVLPHDLAIQLRKVLLPTPSGDTTPTNEELDLEYWQSKDTVLPREVTEEPLPTEARPLFTNPAPLYEEPHRLHSPAIHPSPRPHLIQEPVRTFVRPPLARPPGLHRIHPPQGGPQIFPQEPTPPHHGTPAHEPRSHALHHHGEGMPLLEAPPLMSHNAADPRHSRFPASSQGGGVSQEATKMTGEQPRRNHEGTAPQNDHRLVDPRQKYSHLKIKPKLQEQQPHLPSSLKKPEGPAPSSAPSNNQQLPPLLKDKKHLNKLMAPQELFGSAHPSVTENISLFGSRQQVPDSPVLGGKQSYGEIKMAAGEGDPLTMDWDDKKEEVPVIPSYLTHLGLNINEEDENDVQIDSAFGALQARKRRLSELSSTISDDTNSQQDLVIVTTSPNLSTTKNFSFSSSMFNSND